MLRTLARSLVHRLRSLVAPASQRDPLGAMGERAAARFLKKRRFRILARSVRMRLGEADLLCLAPDRRTVVIAEVKTRRVHSVDDHPYRPPEASITAEKRRKLTTLMNQLARANRWKDRPLRVDVVAIEWPPTGEPVIRHHENVIRVRD